jgi:hypothetical protein
MGQRTGQKVVKKNYFLAINRNPVVEAVVCLFAD